MDRFTLNALQLLGRTFPGRCFANISGHKTCYLLEDYLGVPWVEDLAVVGASLQDLPYLLVSSSARPVSLLPLSLLDALRRSEGAQCND